MNIELREYTPQDFGTLHEIDQACYDEAVAYSQGELRAYLRFRGAECLVAESAGQIAGFCISAHQGERGYIVTIDVLPQFRRARVGTLLLNEIESRLAANGVTAISLETATANESAVAFWQKHGYRSRGIKKDYYPGGRDAFAMSKVLTSSSK